MTVIFALSFIDRNPNISIIYRNYSEKYSEKKIIEIKKFCKNIRKNFFLANDIKLANKLNLDGAYVPAFNNNHSIYMRKDYYMELLETDLALLLSNYFNINYLKDKIHNKNLNKNEDWFLLRIAALLAFSKNHKIGIT